MSREASRTSAVGPRRWPDLLIGLLVLLLLGGFGTLLLKPQHAATTATSNANPIPAAPTSETSAATPTATPPAATPAATTAPQTTTTPNAATSSPEGSAGTPPAANPSQTTTAQPSTTQEPPTIAATPIQAQPETPTTTINPPSATETQGTSQQTASQAPDAASTATPAASTAPRSGGAVMTSANRVPLRSDYRVSLGVYQTARTVRTQTAAVTALGYTVYPINIGDQFVAQIGPFADEASALQALADIQRAYPGARMYRPVGAAASNTTTSPSPTTTPATSAPAAPSGLTYLQVGAFDRVETAQQLVQRLRALGYNPTVNAPAGRKVTVWVGPFSGTALTRTEGRLSANGLDHFRVQ